MNALDHNGAANDERSGKSEDRSRPESTMGQAQGSAEKEITMPQLLRMPRPRPSAEELEVSRAKAMRARIASIMAQRLAERLTFSRKVLLAVAGIAAVVGPLLFGLANSSQNNADSSAKTSGPKPSVNELLRTLKRKDGSVSIKIARGCDPENWTEDVLTVPFQVPLLVLLQWQPTHFGTTTCKIDGVRQKTVKGRERPRFRHTQPLALSMFVLVVPALFAKC